jgi:hypothetical protein
MVSSTLFFIAKRVWLWNPNQCPPGLVVDQRRAPGCPLLERAEDVLDALFGVAEEHLGVLAV